MYIDVTEVIMHDGGRPESFVLGVGDLQNLRKVTRAIRNASGVASAEWRGHFAGIEE